MNGHPLRVVWYKSVHGWHRNWLWSTREMFAGNWFRSIHTSIWDPNHVICDTIWYYLWCNIGVMLSRPSPRIVFSGWSPPGSSHEATPTLEKGRRPACRRGAALRFEREWTEKYCNKEHGNAVNPIINHLKNHHNIQTIPSFDRFAAGLPTWYWCHCGDASTLIPTKRTNILRLEVLFSKWKFQIRLRCLKCPNNGPR